MLDLCEKLTFNPDGTIQQLPFWTAKGVDPVGKSTPYRRVEAWIDSWSEGFQDRKNRGRYGMLWLFTAVGSYFACALLFFNKRGEVI